MASESGTLYTGVTGDLMRRTAEHRSGEWPGFAAKYGCKRLVFYEDWAGATEAIAREKQIKRWRREKKEALIATLNPGWRDLALDLWPVEYGVRI